MKPLNTIYKSLAKAARFWRGETSLQPPGLDEVLFGVAIIAVVRGVIDMAIYIRTASAAALLAVCLLWFFYILSLTLSTAFLFSRFIPGAGLKHMLTMSIPVYWLIPLVPLFSLTHWEKNWGLGIFASTPYFQWIPTFMTERTYLPLGMLVVTPFILFMAYRFIVKTTGGAESKALAATIVVYAIIYVYYYQWSQRALVVALFDKGLPAWEALLASYLAYSFFSQVITFILSPILAREYKQYPLWAYLIGAGVPLALFFLAPRVGVFAVFLAPGRPF